MNLQEWDRLKVGEYLHSIGKRIAWSASHMSEAKELLDKLPVRPVWQTYARDELGKAEEMALTLLRGIKEMKHRYDDVIAIEVEFPRRDDRDDEQQRYETEMVHAKRTSS